MFFRRAVCVAAVAAVFFNISFLTARASWANVPPLKLLTVGTEDICGKDNFSGYLGADCIRCIDGSVYMLDDDAISKWRSTGKANFTKLSVDVDLKGMERGTEVGSDGEYMQFSKRIPDTYDYEYYVVHIDKKSKSLNLAYSWTGRNFTTRRDGYSCAIDTVGSGKVIIFDPSGNTKEMPCPKNGGSMESWQVFDGQYIAVFTWKSFIILEDEKVYYDNVTYGVKTDGGIEEIFAVEKSTYFTVFDASSNCIMWKYNIPSQVLYQYVLFSLEDNKLYKLNEVMTYRHMGEPDFFMTEPDRFASPVNDRRVVLWKRIGGYKSGDPFAAQYKSDEDEFWYYLVRLNENDDADIITKRYDYIGEGNGGIYPMRTYDGRCGYIDKDGNELAMFDRTGEFCGKYAPVFENGGVYLIDRNMNIVSDPIFVDNFSGFWNYGDVFEIHNGYETILATYADNFVDTKGNSTDNPTVGAADLLAPIILMGGAAVVVSSGKAKKR